MKLLLEKELKKSGKNLSSIEQINNKIDALSIIITENVNICNKYRKIELLYQLHEDPRQSIQEQEKIKSLFELMGIDKEEYDKERKEHVDPLVIHSSSHPILAPQTVLQPTRQRLKRATNQQ